MQGQVVMAVEPEVLAALKELAEQIKILVPLLRAAVSQENDEWLKASTFCRRYQISDTTLWRRVQQGKVEKKDFGEKTPRYRWKEAPDGFHPTTNFCGLRVGLGAVGPVGRGKGADGGREKEPCKA